MNVVFLPCSREIHTALYEDGARQEDIPTRRQLSATEIKYFNMKALTVNLILSYPCMYIGELERLEPKKIILSALMLVK